MDFEACSSRLPFKLTASIHANVGDGGEGDALCWGGGGLMKGAGLAFAGRGLFYRLDQAALAAQLCFCICFLLSILLSCLYIPSIRTTSIILPYTPTIESC